MTKEFRLQDPGEGIHEAEIREILVSPGDAVEEGQIVLVIETDKASVEIPSPYSGTVGEIPIETGKVVQVGDLLMTFDGEAGAGEAAPGEEPEPEEREAAEQAEQAEQAERPRREPEPTTGGEPAAEPGKPAPSEPERPREEARRDKPVPASPATRRVAKELGVDLHEVRPSGEGGRVLVDDVRAFAERRGEAKAAKAEEAPQRAASARERAAEAPALPDFSKWGGVDREPLASIRRATARRMALSWSQIPHVTHQDLVDITELEAFRQRHEEQVSAEGGKLTLTAFALKAAAAALIKFPRFNASVDMDASEIVLKRYCHIGVALETDRGLLVPVIRDVERKNLIDLAVELSELADRLRSNEASREDLEGGTFTITNVGGFGGTGFTPIINWPEVAILGLAEARLQPMVAGGLEDSRIVARLMLPICVAFDHRVVDGAEAARFTAHFARALADPEQLALAA